MRSVFTFVCFVTLLIFAGCKKSRDIFPPSAEMYGNKTQVAIGTATLQAGFSGFEITERGICWGTGNDPNTTGPHVKSGAGDGNIVEVITGLTPGTTFFARAYAINKGGTTYSEPVSFLVKEAPQLTMLPVYARNTTWAGLSMQMDAFPMSGSGTYGFCYASHPGPIVGEGSTQTFPFAGTSYSLVITDLSPGTTYFARAFVQLEGQTFFSNEISFNTYANIIYDIDGNQYYTVKIGTQEWMTSNLRTTRYRDGSAIPVVNSFAWSTYTGGCRAVILDNEAYVSGFGRYYNHQAVANVRGLAPAGWRVPSLDDWKQLFDFAGVDSAAFKLVSSNWPGTEADNRYGLSVMPAGKRDQYGEDEYPVMTANFWTSTLQAGYYQSVVFGPDYFDYIPYYDIRQGLSVRCIKD